MASSKLSALVAASALSVSDLMYVSQGGVSKSATLQKVVDLVGGGGGGGGGATVFSVTSRSALAAFTTAPTPFYLSEAGREGWFVWSGANLSAQVLADAAQGLYVAPASDATGGSGAWVRRFSGVVDPLWFGIVPGTGHGTANSTALSSLFSVLRVLATNATTFYQGTIPVRYPAGYFEFGSTNELTDGTFIYEGSTAAGPGGLATVLKFPAGVTGIRTQRYNTSGASSTRTAALGADASIIRNLAIQGAYSSTESETHGIHLRASAHIENVFISNFEGDGVYAHTGAGTGGATEGNTNQSRLYNLQVQGCRDGLNIDGADVNIWTVISLYAAANRRWGVWDSSFLGNSYFGCQADSNGLVPGVAPCVVSQSGNRYCVVNGQAAGASTNAPSGTTASNTWWYYMGAGGVSAPNNIPAWLSGTTYRSGGAYLTDDSGNATNLFSGCYIEGGEGFAQFVTPTLVVGGAMSPQVRGVACLTGAGTQIRSDSDLGALGGLQILGGTQNVGPTTGTTDLTFNLNSTSTETGFWQYLNGVLKGYIRNINGVLFLNAVAGTKLRVNGTDTYIIDANGAGYNTGVGGTVTQATSKATGVALSKMCGAITMNGAPLASSAIVSFTLTNTLIAADDFVDVWLKSGNATAGTYRCWSEGNGSGSRIICVQNISGGSLSEALVLGFGINKRVIA